MLCLSFHTQVLQLTGGPTSEWSEENKFSLIAGVITIYGTAFASSKNVNKHGGVLDTLFGFLIPDYKPEITPKTGKFGLRIEADKVLVDLVNIIQSDSVTSARLNCVRDAILAFMVCNDYGAREIQYPKQKRNFLDSVVNGASKKLLEEALKSLDLPVEGLQMVGLPLELFKLTLITAVNLGPNGTEDSVIKSFTKVVNICKRV